MTRYRQIVIHAGLSKTGSTSIQANCRRYRELLKQYGVDYPVFEFAGRAFDNHSTALVAAVSRAPGKYALGLRRQFGDDAGKVPTVCRSQLDELLSNPRHDTLLLSSERIAGLDDDDMQALRARLEPHTQKLRLIAYIRNPQSVLESIMQERVKAGAIVEPQDIVGRVRRRYEGLQRCFADVLEPINYHEAVEYPGGIVGSFLSLLGIPGQDIQSMSFDNLNERISMEAFLLMDAVNRRYPRQRQQEHGVVRSHNDLGLLQALPGQAFQIPDFVGSDAHRATLEEARWLEARLGFHFGVDARAELKPLWPQETLACLEQIVMQIDNQAIRLQLAQTIMEQADALMTQPGTANTLRAIGRHLASPAQAINPEAL